MKNIIKKYIEKIKKEFRTCVFCEKQSDIYICNDCVENFEKINIFVEGNLIYLGDYNLNKEIMLSIKYFNKAYYIDGIYGYVGKGNILNELEVDIYTYVPTSFKKILKRGYNVPYLMIKKLGRRATPMFRQINDFEMKKLNKTDRESLVKEKYVLSTGGKCLIEKFLKSDKDRIAIVILDDVSTTGSTLNYLRNLICEYFDKYNVSKKKEICIKYFTLFKDII